ncbi:MAG: DUF882 domain-containing protein [Pseudomonadota bacterium]
MAVWRDIYRTAKQRRDEMTVQNREIKVNRRDVLRGWGASAALSLAAIPHASAAAGGGWPLLSGISGLDERHLWIRQAGRQETLHTPFRHTDGSLDLDACVLLSWLFRDWRDADAFVGIDPWLFDRLATVQTLLSAAHQRPLEIVLNSGYRTARRNRTIEGAAANSQHIHGRAADITVPGIANTAVHRTASAAGAHGLGRYSTFTHIDVGPPGRRWRG